MRARRRFGRSPGGLNANHRRPRASAQWGVRYRDYQYREKCSFVGGWWLVVGGWWLVEARRLTTNHQPPTTNHQSNFNSQSIVSKLDVLRQTLARFIMFDIVSDVSQQRAARLQFGDVGKRLLDVQMCRVRFVAQRVDDQKIEAAQFFQRIVGNQVAI